MRVKRFIACTILWSVVALIACDFAWMIIETVKDSYRLYGNFWFVPYVVVFGGLAACVWALYEADK